jgi:hypothetical protein
MLINSPNISGSLTVTGNATISGSLNVAGGINATITGSATTASYVEYSNVANKPTLVSGSTQVSFNGITDKPTLVSGSEQVSFNGIVDKPTLVSGSSQITYSGISSIPSGIVSGSAQIAALGYATTGSNTFQANQVITGSLFISQNLVVAGSSSIQYISSSVVDIADNIITVNAFNPGVRFGGLAVADSGSSPRVSGSILFDSIKDQWIFVHESSATTSSVLLMGPETYNDLGNETYLSANRLPKGSGVEHLRDSNISDTGTVVSINSNTQVTGSLNVSSTGVFSSNLTTNGKLTVSQASTDFVAEIINTQNATPYGLRIKDAATGANNYPLFSVSNNAGSVEYFRVNSGTGTATFSSSVTAAQFLATSNNNNAAIITSTGTAGYGLVAVGSSGGARDILLAGQSGFSNGFTVQYTGTVMRYGFQDGNVGIGTTSPTNSRLLIAGTHVSGNSILGVVPVGNQTATIGLYNSSNVRRGLFYSDTGFVRIESDADPIQLFAAGVNGLTVTTGGNVGIGITTPFSRLHVTNSDTLEGTIAIGNSLYPGLIYSNASSGEFRIDNRSSAGAGYITFFPNGQNTTLGSEAMRITTGGNVLIGETNPPVFSTPNGGKLLMLPNAVIVSGLIALGPPYTQNIQIDIAYNNWGGNNVLGLVDMIITLREYANTSGTAFGKIFATNSGSGATFSSFNTTNITTSQCSVTATSGGNYTLRITIDPSNVTDRGSFYLTIPNAGGTGSTISSITVSYV